MNLQGHKEASRVVRAASRKFAKAWAADRQRIRKLEAELLDTTWQDHADYWNKQACEAMAELARLREENQRLRQEINEHECLDIEAQQDAAMEAFKDIDWEAKNTWHTATGERPEEIDGYPLGDMDAVEAEEYQTNEEPPTLGILSAKDVPWHRVTDYRRVYLDGLPCVMDDKSIEKWAKWVATDKNRGPHQFQFRPEWNSDLWAADEGYAMKNVPMCYATPGDPALSLRRVWREACWNPGAWITMWDAANEETTDD